MYLVKIGRVYVTPHSIAAIEPINAIGCRLHNGDGRAFETDINADAAAMILAEAIDVHERRFERQQEEAQAKHVEVMKSAMSAAVDQVRRANDPDADAPWKQTE